MTEEHRKTVVKQFTKKVRETAEAYNKLSPEEKQEVMNKVGQALTGDGILIPKRQVKTEG